MPPILQQKPHPPMFKNHLGEIIISVSNGELTIGDSLIELILIYEYIFSINKIQRIM